MALASAYTAVILFKLLNSSGVWVLGTSLMNVDDIWYVVNGTIGPVVFYTIAVLLLWMGILGQAKKLSDT